MRKLRADRDRLMGAARAANTRKAYECDWRDFQTWCLDAGRQPLPASEETLSLYLTALLDRCKISTAQRRASAIAARHRAAAHASPLGGEVRKLLSGARRSRREPVQGRLALGVPELRRISAALAADASRLAVRDRAVVLLGFAGGLRRSELAGLALSDVEMERRGLVVHIRHGKTDQEGAGRDLGVHRGRRVGTCPVRAMRAWLRARGRGPGPLFVRVTRGDAITAAPIAGAAVNELVKRAVLRIGLSPEGYGAHSLRAGCATAAIAAGASDAAVMDRTGHRSARVMRRYVRPRDPFLLNPLARVL